MSHELKEQPTCGDTLLPLARTNLPVIAAGALLGMWLTGIPRLFLLYGAAAVVAANTARTVRGKRGGAPWTDVRVGTFAFLLLGVADWGMGALLLMASVSVHGIRWRLLWQGLFAVGVASLFLLASRRAGGKDAGAG